MFDTLSDRLSAVFSALRAKGRLTDADIDATAREIRIALLEADVALPVVKAFIGNIKERARGAEVTRRSTRRSRSSRSSTRNSSRSSAARPGGCSSRRTRRP